MRLNMETIRAESVGKEFAGGVRALTDVSLEILAGELFFLLGASGCGKSTLLRCIAGLETPTEGRIWFGNRDVTTLAPHKREAALVFQSYALWPHLSVGRNIAFGLEERKIPRDEIRRRVDEALESVHLAGFGERMIDQMSGGQQQRVALARALVVKPKCLLLDEPLSNLDARLRIEMRREIRRIVKDNGLTAIYVTHDQEEALAMADRMAILAGGVIEQLGTPEEIYRKPRTSYVAGFIGETNLIDGKVTRAEGGVVEVDGGAPLRGRTGADGWSPAPGSRVKISIRPESWRISERGTLPGTVADSVYLGQRVLYEIDTPLGRQQVMEMNPRHTHPRGAPVRLAVEEEDVVVLQK
jgi:iron(III) transport system ATP-binding protein